MEKLFSAWRNKLNIIIYIANAWLHKWVKLTIARCICISELIMVGSGDNGLLPARYQAITRINIDLLWNESEQM